MKPTLVAAIMLATLVNFTPRGKAQKSTAEQTQAPNNKHPKTLASVTSKTKCNTQDRPEENQSDTDKKSPPWYKTPEWVLVGVGIITAFAIGWQSWESRKAAKAARDNIGLIVSKERAKLRIEVDDFTEQPAENGKIPETYVSYNVCNRGASKAFIVSAKIGAIVDKFAEPNKKLDAAIPAAHKLPKEIEGGSRISLRAMILPKELSSDDFKAVANGTFFVRFFGSIKYTDTFDAERETRFYLRWHPIVKLMNYGIWEKIGPKRYNKAT